MAKFCVKCGAPLSAGPFCVKCGAEYAKRGGICPTSVTATIGVGTTAPTRSLG